jgi:hypothetical protein
MCFHHAGQPASQQLQRRGVFVPHRMRCESWWGTVQPTKRTSTYHSNFGPLPANLTSTSLSKVNIPESQFPKSVGQALALSFSLRKLRI